jgi:hypothetical protein
MNGIAELDIDNKIKEDFLNHKPVGKLMPLVISMYRNDQLEDVEKIIKYKKSVSK